MWQLIPIHEVICRKIYLSGFIKRFSYIRKMATRERLAKLESRAMTAEEIIKSLKNEVEQMKKMVGEQNGAAQVKALKAENEQLKLEIEQWKDKLIQLEMTSSVKQIPLPCNRTQTAKMPTEVNGQVAEPPTPVTHKEVQSESEAAKVEKKKEKKDKPAEGKKGKSGGGGGGGVPPSEEPPIDVGRLDFRVGRIVSAKKHPDADSLYVEDVDAGEGKNRTVVSGLVKFVPLEELQGRLVVLLCNLKPVKMRGVTSEAMVMCASTPEKVEVLLPPDGSVPGDEVHVEGFPRVPDPVLNPKKKIFETVAPDLKTNSEKVATYKGVAFTVPGKGVVTAPSLIDVNIK